MTKYMSSRGLLEDYEKLREGLKKAPRNRFKSWKGSALARELFFGGHEDKFRARGYDVFLTRERSRVESNFKLCFALLSANHHRMLWTMHRFHSGGRVRVTCNEGPPKIFPEGVRGQEFKDEVHASPATMPVEVYKLLSKKGALELHERFAADANQKDARFAALAAWKHRRAFQEKGLGVTFNSFVSSCGCRDLWVLDPLCQGLTKLVRHWLEYADFDVVGQDYLPEFRGRNTSAQPDAQWLRCERPVMDGVDVRQLASDVTARAQGCGQVAGADGDKRRWPTCKCGSGKVWCGGEKVTSGGFNIEEVLKRPECARGEAYCSKKACV